MKLSIIVPVYNAEKFLDKCLDSLVSQTIEDYEIILINDGSKDNSLSVMESYREKYPELIKTVSVENGGQGRARNIGINLARGEYLGFVDSDDWVSAEMYEKMCSAMDAENADVAICGIEEHYEDGRILSHIYKGDRKSLFSMGSSSNKVFRRSAVGSIRFPEGLWYEDFGFSAKVECAADKTISVDETLYMYRIGHSSTMNNNNTLKNLDIIPVMDEVRAAMYECGFEKYFDFLLINHVLLDSVKRVSLQKSPDKKETINKLRAYVKKYIPELSKCEAFKEESRNRRIIMYLNYHGLWGLSKFMLKANGSI